MHSPLRPRPYTRSKNVKPVPFAPLNALPLANASCAFARAVFFADLAIALPGFLCCSVTFWRVGLLLHMPDFAVFFPLCGVPRCPRRISVTVPQIDAKPIWPGCPFLWTKDCLSTLRLGSSAGVPRAKALSSAGLCHRFARPRLSFSIIARERRPVLLLPVRFSTTRDSSSGAPSVVLHFIEDSDAIQTAPMSMLYSRLDGAYERSVWEVTSGEIGTGGGFLCASFS